MAKKDITIKDLAELMQKGFTKAEKDTDKKIDGLAIMVQKGFSETAKNTDMDLKFKEVEKRFDKVEGRLGKIEYLLSNDYKKRLEKAEEGIKELKGLLAA